MLHGTPAPLTGEEYNLWLAYFRKKAEDEKKANKSSKSGREGVERSAQHKPMMGQT